MTARRDEGLVLALSRGRVLEDTMPILERAGVAPLESPSASRKLIFDSGMPNVRLLVVRASDVPTYVAHGAADAGITGLDTLLEKGADDCYELLDLGVSRCRLMTAALVGAPPVTGRMRVASKYPDVTRRWFAARGVQVDVITLSGAMELAPVIGLADTIVDIVSTGNTLRANGLEPLETIAEISTRLVVNRAAMKFRMAAMQDLVGRLREAVAASRDESTAELDA